MALLIYPVVLEGETGCGKAAIARAIHAASPRQDQPFRPFACAAEPSDLIEALLFGNAAHAGLFEQAAGGTVYLHEVGTLSPSAQAQLLLVITEHTIRADGVRVIASTPRGLAPAVAASRFDEHLLIELARMRIMVPSLRERPEDIPMIANHFWRRHVGNHDAAGLDAATLTAFARYEWPGNLRELENTVERLALERGYLGRRHGVITRGTSRHHDS